MCGFAGILLHPGAGDDATPSTAAAHDVERMIATIGHRGPDARACHVADGVVLAHARLSVLDLAPTGAQPMHSASGNVLVYNGECYNHRDLRRALEDGGHRFRGTSDTEVVLAAYDTWGVPGLKRLEGMFAFALWDARQRRLLLMRDRLGIKPLYVAPCALGLAFGSEIKALLATGGVDTTLDAQAFREYLWYGASQEDRTFCQGVRAVPPGFMLVADRNSQTLSPWWRLEEWLAPEPFGGGYADAVRAIQARLEIAVERQLMADVPVGIFLSGGLDSSAIAVAASRVARDQVTCFTADFGMAGAGSEVPKATAVARHLGLPISVVQVPQESLPEAIERMAAAHDEPFADAANIPLDLMCRALEGRAKVVLQGDGGDEVFGGYRRYALGRHASWWRHLPWPQLARLAGGAGPTQRLARVALALRHPTPGMDMALLLAEETLENPPERVLRGDFRAHLQASTDPFLAYRSAARRFGGQDLVQRMLLTDLTVQLPSLYFAKVDRATMASGIEARVPLLDEQVVSYVVRLPSRWKVSRRHKKRLLRDALEGRLPSAILDAPKAGFGVPIGAWTRGRLYDYVAERVLDPVVVEACGLDATVVGQLLQAHRRGEANHGFLLWKLLQVALWSARRASASQIN